MEKTVFNALVCDICNWALNISMVVFLWSLSKFYCVLICGLFVLRFVADIMFKRSVMEQQEFYAKKAQEALKHILEQAAEKDDDNQYVVADDLGVAKVEEMDKKVH